MAKKKQQINPFLSPLSSLKTAAVVAAAITGFLVLNVTTYQKYQQDEHIQATNATKKLLTKSNLFNVLGTSTTDPATTQDAQFQKKPEVKYWYDILAQKPDYRDAYLIIATLAYNDHRCTLAQAQFAQAYRLDPNSVKDSDLGKAIGKCGK